MIPAKKSICARVHSSTPKSQNRTRGQQVMNPQSEISWLCVRDLQAPWVFRECSLTIISGTATGRWASWLGRRSLDRSPRPAPGDTDKCRCQRISIKFPISCYSIQLPTDKKLPTKRFSHEPAVVAARAARSRQTPGGERYCLADP